MVEGSSSGGCVGVIESGAKIQGGDPLLPMKLQCLSQKTVRNELFSCILTFFPKRFEVT